jgi:hypothetical protein
MSTISIHDLRPSGYSLFTDSESYLNDLSSQDELSIAGGAPTPSVTTITTGYWGAAAVGTLIGVTVTLAVAAYFLID